jgi:hypothetical protein
LEYVLVCYSRTHMLRLDRVQYQEIRIAMILICSTPNNSLEVISGFVSLTGKFVYMNFRNLVVVFYRLDHALKGKFETLMELNMGC